MISSKLPVPFKSKRKYAKKDFEFISELGQGSYAKVYKVKDLSRPTKPFKALKVMEIETMVEQHKLYQIYLENEVLRSLFHPNLVSIEGIFEEQNKIYLVLDYLNKGDFSDLLILNYPLKEETIKFYASEIVHVLAYLMANKIVHRDLKPENIMLDDKCHLKVIDFATARIIGKVFNTEKMVFEMEQPEQPENKKEEPKNPSKEKKESNETEDQHDNLFWDDDEDEEIMNREKRGNSFVGTAEYVSPEVLNDIPTDFGADLWAFGCMLYLMYFGKTPFKDKTQYLMFQRIKEGKLEFPEDKPIPEAAKDLIKKLLEADPKKRLGNGKPGTENDSYHLKHHPFFQGVTFEKIPFSPVPYSESFKFKEVKLKEVKEEPKTVPKEEREKKIEIIKKGVLEKKSSLFHYNSREIVIDSTPKIDFIDPSTKQLRRSIYLNKSCSAEPSDESIFFLITSNKTFKLKDANKRAFNWVKIINDTINTYAK